MGWSITFDKPSWLFLLALLPVLWWWSLRSLAGLGKWRQWLALALRSLVVLAVICGLAEIQMKRTSESLTVIYLLDQSLSIPADQRKAMIQYVNEAIKSQRNANRSDKAGVIVFARDAAVEHPPYDENIRIPETIETAIESDATNLAGAIKLAQAALPESTAGRIVIICDGNENIGDAREQARRLADAGVGIDVVPIDYQVRNEVAVEKITVPNDVNRGQPFELRVVLNNLTPRVAQDPQPEIKGKLRIVRKTNAGEQTLEEKEISIGPGKHVYTLREEIDATDFYTYSANFIPADRKQDTLTQNNIATSFTNVRGKGQVLLIEYVDEDNNVPAGLYNSLIERLKRENLQVNVMSTKSLFNSLGELQPYDCVILGNTPREAFTDEQIRMLVHNTREMGAGLIMLGGEHSYGAGGWAGTELEEALPVDFQIRNAQVAPVGALAMIMHACEMPNGNMWQKKIAVAAIDGLGSQDYCGILDWNGRANWQWKGVGGGGLAQVGPNRASMKAMVDKMVPGDMPDFESTMNAAAQSFAMVDVNNPNPPAGAPKIAMKHLIIISDGDPTPPNAATLALLAKSRVTVSTVGIATHGPAEDSSMQSLANYNNALRGRYYKVNNPNNLPKIYQKEVRKISRPLIWENANGIGILRKYPHEMLKGIEGAIPPITGYVRTTVKNNPLVEVALFANEPKDAGVENSEIYNTLLASWTYGLGKSVVWTSDTGQRWANSWSNNWENYDRFFSQMVRWSMRPSGDTGKFNIVTETKDGKSRVIITALNKDDEFINFLQFGGSIIGPDMKPIETNIRQVAPGRYVAEFPSSQSGNYFVMLSPGQGQTPLLTGLNVPYSAEFSDSEANPALLKDIASLTPKGSEPGQVISGQKLEDLLQVNTYRHNLTKAVSMQDIWHWILLCGSCLFFVDVFNRRVAIDWPAIGKKFGAVWNRVLGRATVAESPAVLDRLRSRKAELQQKLKQQQSQTTLSDPIPELTAAQGDPAAIAQPGGVKPITPTTAQPVVTPEPAPNQGEDYTSRLLQAKKKAQRDRKDNNS